MHAQRHVEQVPQRDRAGLPRLVLRAQQLQQRLLSLRPGTSRARTHLLAVRRGLRTEASRRRISSAAPVRSGLRSLRGGQRALLFAAPGPMQARRRPGAPVAAPPAAAAAPRRTPAPRPAGRRGSTGSIPPSGEALRTRMQRCREWCSRSRGRRRGRRLGMAGIVLGCCRPQSHCSCGAGTAVRGRGQPGSPRGWARNVSGVFVSLPHLR